MKTATIVETNVGGYITPATRYRLSEPLDDELFVLVFTADLHGNKETIITPGNPDYPSATIVRLPGSLYGYCDEALALSVPGYTIVEEEQ